MSLRIRKKSGPSAPPMPAGTYPAVCVGVVDLGEQYNEFYKKYEDKLLLIWEIPSQTVNVGGEDKPRRISDDYTASLHEKSNLRKLLVSWRGRPFTEDELTADANGLMRFSVRDMLGTGCFLQVIVEEKDSGTRNKISSAVALPAGMDAPATTTPLIVFDMDQWDDEVFRSLPDWVQDRVKKSTQYQTLHVPTDPVDVNLSDGNPPQIDQKEANPI